MHARLTALDSTPDRVFYLPNFITEAEELDLLDKVYSAPKPKWTQLKNRRLQNWGGIPHVKGMVVEEIPSWLKLYCQRVYDLGIFETSMPNHILVNEYQPGQGIMPHEDGPMYYPTVSTVSLGCHTLLDFYKPLGQIENQENTSGDLKDRFMFSLLLEPRSLLILQDDMYKVYLHGIKEVSEDLIDQNVIKNYDKVDSSVYPNGSTVERKSARVSLTIRHVSKIAKLNTSALFKKKT